MFYALITFSSTKSLLSRNKTKQSSFVNLNLNLYSCNIASERSLSLVMNHLFCWSLTLCHCLCLSHLPSTELPSISLGWPGPFCPASDLHEQVCQLVWHHAPDPFSNEAGPSPVQRSGVHTAEKVQGHREAITFLSPPVLWTLQRKSEGGDHTEMRTAFSELHGWISREANGVWNWGKRNWNRCGCVFFFCSWYFLRVSFLTYCNVYWRDLTTRVPLFTLTTTCWSSPEELKVLDLEAKRSWSLNSQLAASVSRQWQTTFNPAERDRSGLYTMHRILQVFADRILLIIMKRITLFWIVFSYFFIQWMNGQHYSFCIVLKPIV